MSEMTRRAPVLEPQIAEIVDKLIAANPAQVASIKRRPGNLVVFRPGDARNRWQAQARLGERPLGEEAHPVAGVK